MPFSPFEHLYHFELDEMPTPDVEDDPYRDMYDGLYQNDEFETWFSVAPLSPAAEEQIAVLGISDRLKIVDRKIEQLETERSSLLEVVDSIAPERPTI